MASMLHAAIFCRFTNTNASASDDSISPAIWMEPALSEDEPIRAASQIRNMLAKNASARIMGRLMTGPSSHSRENFRIHRDASADQLLVEIRNIGGWHKLALNLAVLAETFFLEDKHVLQRDDARL